MKIIKTGFFAILLLVTLPAFAQAPEDEEDVLTGSELLEGCTDEEGIVTNTAYCMEFVFGFVQTVAMLQQQMPANEQVFCINPNEISLEEVTLNVAQWLDAQPGRLQEPAFVLTTEALNEHYPCAN